MNLKHAKAIRAYVRLAGNIDAEYEPLKPMLGWQVLKELDLKTGQPKTKQYVEFSGQVKLNPTCGRSHYKQLKKTGIRRSTFLHLMGTQ